MSGKSVEDLRVGSKINTPDDNPVEDGESEEMERSGLAEQTNVTMDRDVKSKRIKGILGKAIVQLQKGGAAVERDAERKQKVIEEANAQDAKPTETIVPTVPQTDKQKEMEAGLNLPGQKGTVTTVPATPGSEGALAADKLFEAGRKGAATSRILNPEVPSVGQEVTDFGIKPFASDEEKTQMKRDQALQRLRDEKGLSPEERKEKKVGISRGLAPNTPQGRDGAPINWNEYRYIDSAGKEWTEEDVDAGKVDPTDLEVMRGKHDPDYQYWGVKRQHDQGHKPLPGKNAGRSGEFGTRKITSKEYLAAVEARDERLARQFKDYLGADYDENTPEGRAEKRQALERLYQSVNKLNENTQGGDGKPVKAGGAIKSVKQQLMEAVKSELKETNNKMSHGEIMSKYTKDIQLGDGSWIKRPIQPDEYDRFLDFVDQYVRLNSGHGTPSAIVSLLEPLKLKMGFKQSFDGLNMADAEGFVKNQKGKYGATNILDKKLLNGAIRHGVSKIPGMKGRGLPEKDLNQRYALVDSNGEIVKMIGRDGKPKEVTSMPIELTDVGWKPTDNGVEGLYFVMGLNRRILPYLDPEQTYSIKPIGGQETNTIENTADEKNLPSLVEREGQQYQDLESGERPLDNVRGEKRPNQPGQIVDRREGYMKALAPHAKNIHIPGVNVDMWTLLDNKLGDIKDKSKRAPRDVSPTTYFKYRKEELKSPSVLPIFVEKKYRYRTVDPTTKRTVTQEGSVPLPKTREGYRWVIRQSVSGETEKGLSFGEPQIFLETTGGKGNVQTSEGGEAYKDMENMTVLSSSESPIEPEGEEDNPVKERGKSALGRQSGVRVKYANNEAEPEPEPPKSADYPEEQSAKKIDTLKRNVRGKVDTGPKDYRYANIQSEGKSHVKKVKGKAALNAKKEKKKDSVGVRVVSQ